MTKNSFVGEVTFNENEIKKHLQTFAKIHFLAISLLLH